jgi:hypothetical protein
VPGYSTSVVSSYSRSRSKHPRQRCRNNGPLELVAEEGRGENKVVQLVNPGPNATANAAANPPTNAVANAAANVAGAQQNASANASQNAGAQPPPV